jgi:hypothetical protein
MKSHISNGLVEPQLFCSNDLPTLLHTEDPSWDPADRSVFDYRSFYNRRQIGLRQDELEGLSYETLTGEPHFRILKAVAMLHSEGWNQTHEIPSHELETSSTITNGYTLLWTKPPSNRWQIGFLVISVISYMILCLLYSGSITSVWVREIDLD